MVKSEESVDTMSEIGNISIFRKIKTITFLRPRFLK